MADEVRREWFDKDYYAVLGVPKNASAAEVKKAYRKLAQQHHPDTKQGDPDAEARFKEISAAYDVLGDPEKRTSYDRVREMGASGFGPGFGAPGSGGAGGAWPGGVRLRAGERRRHGRPVRRALRRSGEARRAPAGIPAGRGSRDHGHRVVRRRDDGNDRPDQDRRSGRVLALPRIGSRAGDPADHLPAVSGQRRDRGEPRLLLDVAALPAVRGSRADRGVPLHEVSRDRCGAPLPHPAREDPGRGAQRRQDPSRRQR